MGGEEKLFIILIAIGLVILFVGMGVEAVILVKSYIQADKIECNWIFCTFTTVKSTMTSDCFENGVRVNCSDQFKDLKEMLDNATTLGK